MSLRVLCTRVSSRSRTNVFSGIIEFCWIHLLLLFTFSLVFWKSGYFYWRRRTQSIKKVEGMLRKFVMQKHCWLLVKIPNLKSKENFKIWKFMSVLTLSVVLILRSQEQSSTMLDISSTSTLEEYSTIGEIFCNSRIGIQQYIAIKSYLTGQMAPATESYTSATKHFLTLFGYATQLRA